MKVEMDRNSDVATAVRDRWAELISREHPDNDRMRPTLTSECQLWGPPAPQLLWPEEPARTAASVPRNTCDVWGHVLAECR